MGFFKYFKKRPDVRAVIDVGSHTTKAVIFEVPPLGETASLQTPRIGKKIVLKLPLLYKETDVVTKLREFVFAVVRELERVPEKITVAFGPQLTGVSMEQWGVRLDAGKKKEILSSPKLKYYFEKAVAEHRGADSNVMAIPVHFSLNGYAVSWNENQCGNFFQLAANDKDKKAGERGFDSYSRLYPVRGALPQGGEICFNTFVMRPSEKVRSALNHMKQSLGGMPMDFIPLAIAQKDAVVHACGESDALIVDMGGEETVLVLVRDGRLENIQSFPIGVRHFLRGMSKASSRTIDEIEDLKRQYAQGLISDQTKEVIHEFIVQELELWKKAFVETLWTLYPHGPLPENVFFCGGGAHVPEIRSYLAEGEWYQPLSSFKKPAVRVLEAPRIFEGNSLGGFLQGSEEVGLASLMVYSLCHKSLF